MGWGNVEDGDGLGEVRRTARPVACTFEDWASSTKAKGRHYR